jgi:O-antigen ligase
MSTGEAVTETPGWWERAVERAGWAVVCLLGWTTPLFFFSPTWFRWYIIEGAEIILAKWVYAQGLAALAIVLAGVALVVGSGWRRLAGPAGLAAAMLAGFLGWAIVAVVANPLPGHGWNVIQPMVMLGMVALAGVLFGASVRRVRVFLLGLVGAGLVVALIGVVGGLGVRGLNRVIYGQDPRDAIELFQKMNDGRAVQGGIVSSGAASTLGNPEYAGTYMAALVALGLVLLVDWAPRARRPMVARAAIVGALGLMMAHLVMTSSRQAWVSVVLALGLRTLLWMGVPMRWAAAGFCSVLAVMLTAGIPAAALLGLALGGGAVVWSVRRGELGRRMAGLSPRALAGLAMLPVAGMVVLVAFSTPGPWNPTGLRLLQRFAALSDGRDESLRERLAMYAVASDVVWRNPIAGVGPGRYQVEFIPTLARLAREDESGAMARTRQLVGNRLAIQSHNDYLQIASELGLPALVLFVGMMLAIMGGLVRVARRSADPAARETAVALLVILVAYASIMTTSFPLQMPSRSAVFWALVGAALGLIARATPAEESR